MFAVAKIKVSSNALLLASASPRRRELLAKLGVPFEVLAAAVVEHEEPETEPRAMVLHNAALKATWACAERPGALVLAADTTVALDRTVLNKPRDLAEARAMLKKLSGRTHTVYTGVCLWRKVGTPLRGVCENCETQKCENGRLGEASLPDEDTDGRLVFDGAQVAGEASLPPGGDLEITHCETSEVTFQQLDDERISAYLAQVNPLDKAGAYGIQEGRELILAGYRGSFSNIMGLPLEWLAARLHELALIPSAVAPRVEDLRFRD